MFILFFIFIFTLLGFDFIALMNLLLSSFARQHVIYNRPQQECDYRCDANASPTNDPCYTTEMNNLLLQFHYVKIYLIKILSMVRMSTIKLSLHGIVKIFNGQLIP